MSKIKNYLNETVNEMVHNVTWPTWKELQNHAIIVVIASVIIAILIFAMDFIFGNNSSTKDPLWEGVLGFLYNMFN